MRPEIIRAGPVSGDERSARRATREELGDHYAGQAFEAFNTGDYAQAITIVEDGERACPYGRPGKVTWSSMRQRIEEAQSPQRAQSRPATGHGLDPPCSVKQAFPELRALTTSNASSDDGVVNRRAIHRPGRERTR